MSTLHPERINIAFSKYQNDGGWFNCWGATLYVLGASDRLSWADAQYMDAWLHDNTTPIHRPRKVGDILEVRWRSTGLQHTAVYLGKGKYFHKLGSAKAEVTNLAGVRKIYYGEFAWRRLTQKGV